MHPGNLFLPLSGSFSFLLYLSIALTPSLSCFLSLPLSLDHSCSCSLVRLLFRSLSFLFSFVLDCSSLITFLFCDLDILFFLLDCCVSYINDAAQQRYFVAGMTCLGELCFASALHFRSLSITLGCLALWVFLAALWILSSSLWVLLGALWE